MSSTEIWVDPDRPCFGDLSCFLLPELFMGTIWNNDAQPKTPKSPVGGFKHDFYFPSWDVILPN
jgi:hypothetical protein